MTRTYRERESQVSPWIKWIMFAFNLIFWLVSLCLIGVGIWAYFATEEFNANNGTGQGTTDIFDILFDFSLIVIALGVLVFFLSLFGLLGSLRENVCMLKTFSISLGILFLVEVGVSITVLVMASQAQSVIEDILQDEAIREYRDDINRQNVIDWFQETFECCGVGEQGWTSWKANKYFSCPGPGFEACSVPYSCCLLDYRYQYDSMTANTRCGHDTTHANLTASDVADRIFTRGCVSAAIEVAKDNIFLVGGLALAIVLPQLIGIALSWTLAMQVDRQRKSSYYR